MPGLEADVPDTSAPRTRVGLIGAGSVAARHAATLAGFDDVEVVAVQDAVPAAAQALADHHGAAAYETADAMLADARLDAVYVCVPPFAHGPPEHAVLDAGLPLFVEKPLAVDLRVAEEIAARIEAAGTETQVGYHWRYLDTLEEAAALLRDHAPRLVQAIWIDKVPPPAWWVHRAQSGGQAVEQTTHVLDLVRVLAGEVAEVSAIGSRMPREAYPDADVDDVTAATLRFRDGAIGSVLSSSLPAAKFRAGVEIVAEGLVIELTESSLAISDADGRRERAPRSEPKTLVDRAFIDAVRGLPADLRAPYPEALRTHRLACALTRSADERRPVTLDEATA